jgi:hypothetical protein
VVHSDAAISPTDRKCFPDSGAGAPEQSPFRAATRQGCSTAGRLSGNLEPLDTLATLISSVLRDNDPLDPWLAASNYDENYWDGEAQAIALRVNPRMDLVGVRAVIVDVLGGLLGFSADGDPGLQEQARRIDRVAEPIIKSGI